MNYMFKTLINELLNEIKHLSKNVLLNQNI